MPVRLGRFEMPKRLTKEDTTSTPLFAKFVAEPFETGYGHTIVNSCIAPSILTEVMAAPSREERSTRRSEFPMVWP